MFEIYEKRTNGMLSAYINTLTAKGYTGDKIAVLCRKRWGYIFPDVYVGEWVNIVNEYLGGSSPTERSPKNFKDDYLQKMHDEITVKAVDLFTGGHNLVSITRILFNEYGKTTGFSKPYIEDISAHAVLDYVNAENKRWVF